MLMKTGRRGFAARATGSRSLRPQTSSGLRARNTTRLVTRSWMTSPGVDEHRFRSIRFVTPPDGPTVMIDPCWSIVFTDLDTGAVLNVVDGRRGTRGPLVAAAIDMSAEFRAAIRDVLPTARIMADHWHVMTRANHMVTQVRRRRSLDLHARRGRIVDPAAEVPHPVDLQVGPPVGCPALEAGSDPGRRRRAGGRLGDRGSTVQLLATRTSAQFAAEWDQLETALRATDLPGQVRRAGSRP